MNLFVNTISSFWKIILFDEKRKIISEDSWEVVWNESSTIIPKIDEILQKNNLEYKDLENIVLVNGPWSFTWVRTTTLAINTINFVIKKNITTLNYFDLFNKYPICRFSSKRDCFVKFSKNSEIEILENKEFLKRLEQDNISEVYWEWNSSFFNDIKIFDIINYSDIINTVKFDKIKRAEAFYIKKPNIS
jgi:tRNA A37 threonylcarbamoyladenosine modification protein TsaB